MFCHYTTHLWIGRISNISYGGVTHFCGFWMNMTEHGNHVAFPRLEIVGGEDSAP